MKARSAGIRGGWRTAPDSAALHPGYELASVIPADAGKMNRATRHPDTTSMEHTMHSEQQPIAIVGVSALFPGSSDASGFWRDILAGRDLIGDVPPTHWRIEDYYDADPGAPDKTYARRGGFLSPVDFDALGWGVPPSTLPATDTAQLLALVVAQSVLQDAAREQFEQIDRSRISVILGVTSAQELLFSLVSRLQRPVWERALRETGLPEDQVKIACEKIAANYVPWQEASFPGLLGNVVAGRIANRLNLGGTNCVTDAACASSFSALSMGVNELQLGHSDLVIAGGVDTLNDIFMYMCFSKTPALSPSGDCRPFSDQADGTMLGEGLGMVALKRLSDAERDGDRVYAVLRGIGTSSDGRSKSVYAPVAAGQAKALSRAYQQASYGADTVELMEAHGTGTKAGDVAEFEGLRMVFDGSDASRRQWCALGSVKSQIGHTKAAAGAAGLFKTVMALQHKVLPPTIKVAAPNPKLAIEDSPFYLNTEARPWIRGSAHPRRASVSAFGFGGSNFHLTLEEYTGPAPRAERLPTQPADLVLLQADSAGALQSCGEQLLADQRPLAHIAADSRRQWNPQAACRLAIVAGDREALRSRLSAALQRIAAQPEQDFELPDGTSYGCRAFDGKLAALFPGQGSQYLGMGAALAMQFDAARAVWDRAADIRFDESTALHHVVFPRPVFDDAARAADAARLTATEWAQPALAACSAAQWRLLTELGIEAELFAGHSFGEVMALHAAGAFDLPTALRLARWRGELMRDAATTPGAMLALSLPVDEVRTLLAAHAPDLVVANHNAPQQVVVSGPLAAIDAFETALAQRSIACKRLPVATAFHSSVVADAARGLAAALKKAAIKSPTLPVYGNSSAAEYPTSAAQIRKQLAEQLAQPVRFVEMIEAMYAAGARCFVEVGAGAVLGGLVGAILGQRPHRVVSLDRRGRDGVEALLVGLGRLAAAGVAMQPERLFADVRLPVLPVKSKLAVPVCGSNLGKPYPPADPNDWPAPNAVGGDAPNDATAQLRSSQAAMAAGGINPPRGYVANVGAAMAAIAPSFETVAPPIAAMAAPTLVTNPAPLSAAAAASTSESTSFMPTDPTVSAAWLAAFQEHQQQTAMAHAAFQRALADSHTAYLGMAESALSGLNALLGQGVMPAQLPVAQPLPATPTMTVPATMQPAPTSVLTQPTMRAAAECGSDLGRELAPQTPIAVASSVERAATSSAAAPMSAPAPVAATSGSVETAARAVPSPLPSSTAATPALDLAALLLEIVADKTGYPVDMLNLDMDLEGDLGIDSIKRVEILAAVDQRAPQLPKLDRSRLGSLHTLGEIVGVLQSAAGAPTTSVAASLASALPVPAAAAPAVDLAALLLAVVADKTGYPVDMLNLDMDLEGDLGIDSIKRVEILAAVDERAPQLPKLDRARLGTLHTLAEIIDYLGGGAAAATAPAAPVAPPSTTVTATRPGFDLAALLLAVVADKTGYPVDMLNLDMDLEGDLGIDSIKRVEILAAVDERAPQLPKLDRARLATLHTLAEIIDYLGGGAAAAPTPVASNPTPAPVATNVVSADRPTLGRYVVEPLAVPAGGFAMSGLRSGDRVWIVGHDAIGAALVRRLRARGVNAHQTTDLPNAAQACIHLGGLAELDGIDAALAVNREVFATARQLAANLQAKPGLFVVAYDGGGAQPWLGGLPALLKTCALEWPQAALKAIDLERGGRDADALAAVLADELLAGGGEIELVLPAAGGRYTAQCLPRAAAPSSSVIEAGDVVLVSGGARGVTAACLQAWAGVVRPRLVLLGRTRLDEEPACCAGIDDDVGLKRALLAAAAAAGRKPSPAELQSEVNDVQAQREIRATLAAIAATGGEAHYRSAAVDDPGAIETVLGEVRQSLGPIRGLIHAAGVLADRRIADKTDAQFDRVFDTKVQGLRVLLDATANDPLRLLCVFSSVSARCGNTGQSDYAMANEVLARVARAEAQRRPGLRVKSLGWGPWEGGMVSPQLKQRFAELGVPMIPLDVGAQMFVDEMNDASGAVELVLGGEPRPEALLADGADGRIEALEMHVQRDSHGYLEGHAVNGQPVVPVVLVAEWLTRAARSWRPGLQVLALHDLKVLKGIRLHGFENGGDRFRIEARVVPGSHGRQLQMTVHDTNGHPNYSARVLLGDVASAPVAGMPELAVDAWSGEPLYGELLFHRGRFELIDAMHGISDHGVSARVHGVHDANWPGEAWQLDVAALDGGLQMAVLYGQRMLGGPNLPTSIGELRAYGTRPVPGPITVAAYRRQVGATATTTDILFSDARGQRVAELIGVQNHALPA
jgi:acyl transferase domain-containing protein